MGTVKNFEDLAVWKMAREMVNRRAGRASPASRASQKNIN
jgi:hypothetical protein